MKILITGATGLIGKSLIPLLIAEGHKVVTLSRAKINNPKIESFLWSVEEGKIDEKAFENVDAIIHLAGENISEKRWTKIQKERLFNSRISSTNLLLEQCNKHNLRLKYFISASGISYYGSKTDSHIFTESDAVGSDFLSQLTLNWEQAADSFKSIADKIIKLRISMVLSKNGGALAKLNQTMKFGPAAIIGSGKQWVTWIHIEDLCGIILHSLNNLVPSGSYNMVADEVLTNAQFMKILGQKLHRPRIYVPAFVLKIMLGEMSSLLLEGSRASNSKIKETSYMFKYKKVKNAIDSCF